MKIKGPGSRHYPSIGSEKLASTSCYSAFLAKPNTMVRIFVLLTYLNILFLAKYLITSSTLHQNHRSRPPRTQHRSLPGPPCINNHCGTDVPLAAISSTTKRRYPRPRHMWSTHQVCDPHEETPASTCASTGGLVHTTFNNGGSDVFKVLRTCLRICPVGHAAGAMIHRYKEVSSALQSWSRHGDQ